jgi:hypothetical protein
MNRWSLPITPFYTAVNSSLLESAPKVYSTISCTLGYSEWFHRLASGVTVGGRQWIVSDGKSPWKVWLVALSKGEDIVTGEIVESGLCSG